MKHWHENRRVGIGLSRALGNTNTNQEISKSLVAASIDWDKVTSGDTFLEPAVGAGSFYFALVDALLERFDVESVFPRIKALDIDASALDALKTGILDRYGPRALDLADIEQADFLTHDVAPVDWIVTNPPYISDKNIQAPFNQEKSAWLAQARACVRTSIPSRSDIYMFFHIRALELLNPGGTCIFLCSDSWIGSNFGDSLKSMILDGEWTLDTVLNSQLLPFFRDDTNAILTRIRRLKAGEKRGSTRVTNLRVQSWQDADLAASVEMPVETLSALLRDDAIPNRRNAFLLFHETYKEIEEWHDDHKEAFVPFGKVAQVLTSSIGASSFEKDKLGRAQRGPLPVFWQLQARSNRPPDYRTFVPSKDLSLWIDPAEAVKEGKPMPVREGVYFSTIIDRFPLLFYSDQPTVHVNKYFCLETDLDPWVLAALMQSVFGVLFLEQRTKEGTRKTLRTGECGLAKEISKTDLVSIVLPSPDSVSRVIPEIKAYQSRVIFNFEEALKDAEYWSVQKEMARALGLEKDLPWVVKTAVFLYVLRMRHLEKLASFDAWYNKEHGQRLFQGG